MRLLVLDQFSDPGGAQKCLLELLPAIHDRGWEALVGLPGEGELFQEVRALGFEVERVDCGPYASGSKSAMDLARFLTGTPRLARQISKLADRVKADLVYLNGPRLVPAALGARLPVPVLFHSHSFLFPGATRNLTGLSLRGLRAWVVAACQFVAEPWRKYVPSERISVVYNGVAGPGVLTASNRGCPKVGCIGRIAPEKGQREFLTVASLINRAVPGCQFVIYGAPLFSDAAAMRYDAEVRVAATGLPVEFSGWVTDVYGALADLDLLLVPSAAHEATPRVIPEAFAAGVSVIAFRGGGIPEQIDDGINGLLAQSPEEMGRMAVELLSGDRARLRAMSEAARETWRRRFTLQGYQRQVLDLMEKICGRASA